MNPPTASSGHPARHVPVLVVGGGPVGLAMGLALGRFGVQTAVIERRATTTDHPRSRGCWVRTMEIFRQWGVEDAIRSRGLPEGTDVFVYFDPVRGEEYGRTTPEPRADQSPTWKSLVAQDAVEESLLGALESAETVEVHFSTELSGLTDRGDHVEVELRDPGTGATQVWTADWVVAADGAGSTVRRAVGIEMIGPAVLAVMTNEYVHVDISDLPIAKEAAAIMCVPSTSERPPLGFLNTDGQRWLMGTRVGAVEDERERPFSDEEVAEMVGWYLGVPDRRVTRINSSIWRMSNQVASTFRAGRVLLAGDAAHRFPPTGGFGLNTGVQDAHNLAWKLAYVLRGVAAPALLDTYDAERRPVARSNADFSVGNSLRMQHVHAAAASGEAGRFDFWIDDLDNHLHSVGQSLGFHYSSPAVIDDGSTPPAPSSRFYTPTDRPGHRFPHLWVAPGVSTLDWFDRSFTLVTGEDGTTWRAAAADVQARTGVAIDVRVLPPGAREAGCRTGRHGAALVRPDGHVAWRVAWAASDRVGLLQHAVNVIRNGEAPAGA